MKKPTLFLPLSILCSLLVGSVFGQGIVPVKDINVQPPSATGFQDSIASVNGTLFIASDDSLSGAELWKSNGTLAGTSLVKDIVPGSTGSALSDLTAVGTGTTARLFFSATTDLNEENLWISDGTAAGTRLVKDFNFPSGGPDKLFAVGNTLFFEGYDSTARRELWKSDLAGNAVLIKDINPTAGATSAIDEMIDKGGVLYFTANDGGGREIWRSNGTEAGTVKVTDVTATPLHLMVFNNQIFFSGLDSEGRELWKSDGVSTAVRFFDVEPNGSSDPEDMTAVGTTLFFSAARTTEGRELWLTDGISLQPTAPVKDINPGTDSSDPDNLISIKVGTAERLLFTANDGSNGVELWRSDGTNGGTALLTNIAAGSASSNPSNFVKFGPTTVLFTATDASDVLALWKCEGSTGSFVTTKLLNLPPATGATTAVVRDLVLVPGSPTKLYFMLNDDELWQSDASTAGTVRIKHFRAGDTTASTAGSFPADFTPHGATEAFFSATDGLTGRELWKTDGTEAGTSMVSDIFPDATGSDPLWLTSAGTHLFFTAVGSGTDRELWWTDGTTTEQVKDINVLSSSTPQNLFWSSTQNLLFFSATDGVEGRELWRSDGTIAGTFMVKEMVNFGDSNPRDLVLFRDKVFFVGGVDGAGTELLSSEGVLNDITFINIASGGASSNPAELTVMEDNLGVEYLYFVATAGSHAGVGGTGGRELWKSDGTEAGTLRVKDIVSGNGNSNPENLTVVGKTLFFTAASSTTAGAQNVELWKSDGVVDGAGTVMVKEIASGTASSSPEQLVEVNGKLFFVATNSTGPGTGNGAELWVSNGTAAGTMMVKDIVAGPGSPGIQELRNVNGVAVFTADDGVHGRELWISDGTAVGTFTVPDTDLTGDGASSAPAHLTDFNGRLLYSAATYAVGQEPHLGNLDPEITIEQPPGSVLASGVGEVDFGSASLVNNKILQFQIRNDGLNGLKSIAATLSGANAAEFSLVAKPPTNLGPGATFLLSVKFTPKALGVRTATLTIVSSDPDENPFIISLKGTGEAVFTQQPAPQAQVAVVGTPVTFTVGVNAAGQTAPAIQWRKAGAAIPGATDDEYTIPSVKLADAASYTVQVKVGTTTAVSSASVLATVDNTPKLLIVAAGSTATLKVDTKGTGLTFEWWRQVGANAPELLVEGAHFKTVTKNTMTVNKAEAANDSATYFCKVTGPGPAGPVTVVGGTTDLRVFSDPPSITTFSPPDGIVSGPYSYQVVMSADPKLAPTTFAIKGLPPGLKIDTKTGLISGKPTKSGEFKVVLTASNGKGKAVSSEETIQIAAFPNNVAGIYAGLVERNGVLNANIGGRVDLVITPTGTFTGSLTLGTTKYPLKGDLNVDVDQSPSGYLPNATIAVKRAAALPPLTVFFEIQNNGLVGNSQVNDGTNIAGISGWRQVWNASTVPGVANPATAYQAYYTLGIKLAGGPETLPQGWGYGAFTVAKDGKLTIAGKTADGEGITCAAFVGPGGEVLVFQPLYTTTPKGSLLGQMMIGLGANPSVAADNTLGGALDWVRPQDLRTAARTYEDGFGNTGLPVELDVLGGPYGPITGDTMVMGVTAGVDNVQVLFTKGGLEFSSDVPDLTFSLGAKNKVTVPPTGPLNPTATKFSLAAATGLFSGSFTLDDPNPRTPPVTPATIKRTVNYYGIIINDGVESHGVGFFLAPTLPEDGPPATTPTTSDILSGAVEFQAVP